MVKNSLRFILVITVAVLINGAAIQAMELTKAKTISTALASGTSDKEITPRIPSVGSSNTIKSNSDNGAVVKSISTISVKDFGAVGDGLIDDTLAIQKALNKGGTIVFPAGIYLVNVGKPQGLHVISNSKLIFKPSAKLQCMTNENKSYTVILVKDADNVTISDASIIGDRKTHNGTTGEWGFGICVINSSNVLIENTNISNCWGDGIYLGTASSSSNNDNENITLKNVICDNNRRQGLSIINGKHVRVLKSRFTNTHGTPPQSGIDIEPNTPLLPVIDILIDECYFENNANYDVVATNAQKIVISNCTLLNSSKSGNSIYIGTTVKNVKITNNFINSHSIIHTSGINVLISDSKIYNKI